jgi:hypothetical protein
MNISLAAVRIAMFQGLKILKFSANILPATSEVLKTVAIVMTSQVTSSSALEKNIEVENTTPGNSMKVIKKVKVTCIAMLISLQYISEKVPFLFSKFSKEYKEFNFLLLEYSLISLI